MSTTVARNAPCPCGSGKKYKQCCQQTGGAEAARRTRKVRIMGSVLAACAIVAGWQFGRQVGLIVAGAGVLLLGLYLFVLDDPPPPAQGGNPGAINFGQ